MTVLLIIFVVFGFVCTYCSNITTAPITPSPTQSFIGDYCYCELNEETTITTSPTSAPTSTPTAPGAKQPKGSSECTAIFGYGDCCCDKNYGQQTLTFINLDPSQRTIESMIWYYDNPSTDPFDVICSFNCIDYGETAICNISGWDYDAGGNTRRNPPYDSFETNTFFDINYVDGGVCQSYFHTSCSSDIVDYYDAKDTNICNVKCTAWTDANPNRIANCNNNLQQCTCDRNITTIAPITTSSVTITTSICTPTKAPTTNPTVSVNPTLSPISTTTLSASITTTSSESATTATTTSSSGLATTSSSDATTTTTTSGTVTTASSGTTTSTATTSSATTTSSGTATTTSSGTATATSSGTATTTSSGTATTIASGTTTTALSGATTTTSFGTTTTTSSGTTTTTSSESATTTSSSGLATTTSSDATTTTTATITTASSARATTSFVADGNLTTMISTKLTTKPPTITPTTSPTFGYRNLHFLCRYKDNKKFISQFLSLGQYAKLLIDAILSAIESVSYQSVNYDDVEFNSLTPWKKAGIIDFIICNVFDTELIINGIQCPSYSDSNDDDDEYIAIGIFGIVVNDAINAYKKKIIEIMISNEFKNKLTENMNNKINNNTANKRRRRRILLSEYNSFSIIDIDIIDQLNNTTTESEDGLNNTNNKNSNINTIIIIIIICLLLIIIIFAVIIYFKKIKNKNNKINENTEGIMEGNKIEMGEQHNFKEGIVEDGITKNNENNDNDKEIVDIINETHTDHHVVDDDDVDEDIINVVNQTMIGDNNNNNNNNIDVEEGDIINALNQTHDGIDNKQMIDIDNIKQ